ncbi:MAG: histidinol-phosphatase HisJ family protein [Ruminococcaceae bacterium]|nr:histidinol-phosphatase HisJ family protein [Oscillospiraceae bacterium]
MRLPDYHVHTRFSPDSSMEPQSAVEAAIRAGITDLCFTEHMDLGHNMEKYDCVPKLDEMAQSVRALGEKYPEIRIRSGLEAGYIPETAAQTKDVLSSANFDYVLLSTHCVGGLDCCVPESTQGGDKPTAYRRYLEAVYESITDESLADCYDCIGHIGYIAKCLHYEDNTFPYELFPQLFDDILRAIIKREKGIEVNTSGIIRGGHVLPHPSIVARYHELGGRIITVGSDAHIAENVGLRIADTLAMLKDCGFREVAVFSGREPEFIAIQ